MGIIYDDASVRFALTPQEKIEGLKEIIKRLKKILFVYEKSLEPCSNYDYKQYLAGVLLYVQTTDSLFNGELISILVNLESIRMNDFNKSQIKKLVLETVNIASYLLKISQGEEKSRGIITTAQKTEGGDANGGV